MYALVDVSAIYLRTVNLKQGWDLPNQKSKFSCIPGPFVEHGLLELFAHSMYLKTPKKVGITPTLKKPATLIETIKFTS